MLTTRWRRWRQLRKIILHHSAEFCRKSLLRKNWTKRVLGGLINLIGSAVLGTKEAQSKDILGRVFEYFLGEFALAEGKKGGQFYTPGSVVRLLVEMLEPYEGRVFDPCCGSGGMFVQSEKFVDSHRDRYKNGNGQEDKSERPHFALRAGK